jgi:alginate O-acetyltransferase complex protein AlgJ
MASPAHRRRMLAVIAVVLLTPGALFAAGVRASEFENHALAPFPGLEAGWDLPAQLDRWTTDNIPLREQGVQLNTWIDTDLFGDPPGVAGNGGSASVPPGVPGVPSTTSPGSTYPLVVAGDGGYLFYGADFRLKCEPTLTVDQIMQSVATLADAAEASGRRFVLAVPPDKSSVLAEYLPAHVQGRECAARRSRDIVERLGSTDNALDLHGPVTALASTGASTYLTRDSHWDGSAAVVMSRLIVEQLDPGVAQRLVVRRAPDTTMTGDLTILTGDPSPVTLQRYEMHSPAVNRTWRTVQPISDSAITYTSQGPAGTQVEGRTLLVGDSFSDVAGTDLPALFRDFTKVSYVLAGVDPALLADHMIDSDTIVLQMVERAFASGQPAILDPDVAGELARQLRANPR